MKQECDWKETEKRNHILEGHNLKTFFSCPLHRPKRIGYKIRIIYKKMTMEAILFTYQFIYQLHVSRFQGKPFGNGGHDGCPSLLPVAGTKIISKSILSRKGFCSSDSSQVTVCQWGVREVRAGTKAGTEAAWWDAAYWLATPDLLGLLSLYHPGPPAQVWHYPPPSKPGPPTSMINQDSPTGNLMETFS